MSLLSQLAPQEGATHYKKRLGRGRGSGLGQTSAKGHKGQLARSGGRVRRGFEGGQSPLSRRLPKYGFNNPFAIEYDIVNLAQLNRFSGTVDAATLKKAGVIHGETFKVLGRGKIEKALTVKANKFSETAQKAIEAAGGKIEVVK